MQVAYFDCVSGVSGDMILGALLDCGLKIEDLKKDIGKLNLKGLRIKSRRVKRSGISAVKFDVLIDKSCEKKLQFHSLRQILKLIDDSLLNEKVKANSKKAFEFLAEAEASVHGDGKYSAHLHEVGMADSIVDVVGSMAAMERLGIEEAYSSPIPLGRGFVDTAHGQLPVPAPATLKLLKGIPVIFNDTASELATPTGVAILKTIVKCFKQEASFEVTASGAGAGDKDFASRPNILRIILGRTTQSDSTDEVLVLETNIDDMRPLYIERLFERFKEIGALDFWVTPIQMKKSRPAFKVSAIIEEDKLQDTAKAVFEETTSFGIRYYKAKRKKLIRRVNSICTKYGLVRVKSGSLNGKATIASAEYDDCLKLARSKGVALREVYEAAEDAVRSNGTA